jgi:hypothetical protein
VRSFVTLMVYVECVGQSSENRLKQKASGNRLPWEDVMSGMRCGVPEVIGVIPDDNRFSANILSGG